jgi:PIN domain nuclease of toxin-antitoxin system
VLDASAVLAYLFGEAGGEAVEDYLLGNLLAAPNYIEILTKALDLGMTLEATLHDFDRLGIIVVPLDADQSVAAAAMRLVTRDRGLSLADRACLALALTRALPAVTMDRAWEGLNVGVPVKLLR